MTNPAFLPAKPTTAPSLPDSRPGIPSAADGIAYAQAVERQFKECFNPLYRRDCMYSNPLFCRYRGELFRCTGWGPNGVQLVRDHERFWGVEVVADMEECVDWSASPEAITGQEVRTHA